MIRYVKLVVVLVVILCIAKIKQLTNMTLSPGSIDYITFYGYDRYIMAFTWMNTLCKQKHCSTRLNKNRFNVHGLWPHTSLSSTIRCKKTKYLFSTYDGNIEELLKVMQAFDGNHARFIEYEVQKHGSCFNVGTIGLGSDIEIQKIAVKYRFNDDKSHFNAYLAVLSYMGTKLRGVLPAVKDFVMISERMFTLKGLIMSMERKLNVKNAVIPVCWTDPRDGVVHLYELRFCLSVDFIITECNRSDIEYNLKKCNSTSVIMSLV